MDILKQSLRRARRRLAVQQAIRFNVAALVVSLTACALAVLLTKLFPVLGVPHLVCCGLIASGLVVASAWAVFRRPSLGDAALEADHRFGLQERLTSSLALEGVEGPLVEALHADARHQLERVDVARAFPLAPPHSTRWILAPLLAIGVAAFVPEYDLLGFRHRQAEAKIQEQAKKVAADKLKSVARPLKEASAAAPPGDLLADISAAVEEMAEQLEAGKLTEKQAVAKLTDLAQDIQARRAQLEKNNALPKLPEGLQEYGAAEDLAKAVQQGDFSKAAEEAKKLKEKLEKGDLKPEEKQQIAADLKKLSEMLQGQQEGQKSALAEALSKAAEGLSQSGEQGQQALSEALDNVELSLEDVASAMEQLDKLDTAMQQIAEFQKSQLGESSFCRTCGAKLKPCPNGRGCKGCGSGFTCVGSCSTCSGAGVGAYKPGYSQKYGSGMGGPGRGRGGSTGPVPDVAANFEPSVLPGEMTQGKVLADLIQRTTPNKEDVNPTTEFITGTFTEVEQQAEQALTKEEIPSGSKALVREYFESLDPQAEPTAQPAEAGHEAGDEHTHEP